MLPYWLKATILLIGGLGIGLTVGALPSSTRELHNATFPTFYRDVLPILQQHCQVCHRRGEIAPMPLVTYPQVKPYARAIQ